MGIPICGTCGLQCNSKLDYFNFVNRFHLWIVFFSLAKQPVCPILSSQVWVPLGAEIQGKGKKPEWTENAYYTQSFAQKNIFIQAQYHPPLYYCVTFHMKLWFLLFSWYGLAGPQCGQRCPAKSSLGPAVLLKYVPVRHTRDEKVEQGNCVICESFPSRGHSSGKGKPPRGKTSHCSALSDISSLDFKC